MDKPNEGPWLYRPLPGDDWGVIRDMNGKLVAVAKEGRMVSGSDYADCRMHNRDPSEPNARLIVLAPEMLDMLKIARAALASSRDTISTLAASSGVDQSFIAESQTSYDNVLSHIDNLVLRSGKRSVR